MIDADSQMTSITAFAAGVNGDADPTIVEGMGPHGSSPWRECDGPERNSELDEAVTYSAQHWFALVPFAFVRGNDFSSKEIVLSILAAARSRF
jgi:hypothetical protein